MKNNKAVSPDGIPVKVWKFLGEWAAENLIKQCNVMIFRDKADEPHNEDLGKSNGSEANT